MERLKRLKERGEEIITPSFAITYNPFKDVFIVDVPDDRKYLWFTVPNQKETLCYDMSGLYPVEVASSNYQMAMDEIQMYSLGATKQMIPTFNKNGEEYMWFETDEEGMMAVPLRDIRIICEYN